MLQDAGSSCSRGEAAQSSSRPLVKNRVIGERREIELGRWDEDRLPVEHSGLQQVARETRREIRSLQPAVTVRTVMGIDIAFERADGGSKQSLDLWMVIGMDQYIPILAALDWRDVLPPARKRVP